MEQQQQHRTAWERQLLIRDKNRPTVRDYIPRIFTDFYEMHGGGFVRSIICGGNLL